MHQSDATLESAGLLSRKISALENPRAGGSAHALSNDAVGWRGHNDTFTGAKTLTEKHFRRYKARSFMSGRSEAGRALTP